MPGVRHHTDLHRGPLLQYTIDEALCGCGKCVKGCALFGNGSLYLQVKQDLCVHCNECADRQGVPGDAYRRIPAEQAYLLKARPQGADRNEALRTSPHVCRRGRPGGLAWAEFRFPMPEFESGMSIPRCTLSARPHQRPVGRRPADLRLGWPRVCAETAIVRRCSATVCSLAYFGFWRRAASVLSGRSRTSQGVLGLEVVSIAVVCFFLLLLVFALFGRVFCAAVCPLGALQEVVAVRPVILPRAVDGVLGIVPYLYLGLTILAVATGSGYLICQYDPFVGFFRFGASLNMFLAGGVLLVTGLFIGRPYCRFLCPYGVLLGWMSRFSKWHASITPRECIQCRLCEEACPYGAINVPTPDKAPLTAKEGARKLGVILALAPVIVALGACTGLLSHTMLARIHPTVQLAQRIAGEEAGRYQGMTIESEAFRAGVQTKEELYAEAHAVRADLNGSRPCWWVLGLVLAAMLASLSMAGRATITRLTGRPVSVARVVFRIVPLRRMRVPLQNRRPEFVPDQAKWRIASAVAAVAGLFTLVRRRCSSSTICRSGRRIRWTTRNC